MNNFETYLLEIGRKLAVHKTSEDVLYVFNILCTFNLRSVSRGYISDVCQW